jgi:hypothetical protein
MCGSGSLGTRIVVLGKESLDQGSRVMLDVPVSQPCRVQEIPDLVLRLEGVSQLRTVSDDAARTDSTSVIPEFPDRKRAKDKGTPTERTALRDFATMLPAGELNAVLQTCGTRSGWKVTRIALMTCPGSTLRLPRERLALAAWFMISVALPYPLRPQLVGFDVFER